MLRFVLDEDAVDHLFVKGRIVADVNADFQIKMNLTFTREMNFNTWKVLFFISIFLYNEQHSLPKKNEKWKIFTCTQIVSKERENDFYPLAVVLSYYILEQMKKCIYCLALLYSWNGDT